MIAASEIALHCVLLPILKKFRTSYPGIRIRISNHSTPRAIDILKKGLADFAMVTAPFELPTGLSSHVLRTVQEVPVCSHTFPLSNGTALTAELMKQYSWIGLGENTSSFTFYSDYFHNIGLSFSPDVEAATADQILPMVKSDLGIGFVPREFLEQENMEHLTMLTMEPPIPERNICLLKRKNTSISMAASALEKLVRQ